MNYIVGEKYDGMVYVGEACCGSVFDCRPLPLFGMSPETPKSRNAKARALFLRQYTQEHGHEPENFEAEYAEHV